MNERIRELWEQAKTSGVHPKFGEYDKYSAEKFAELIVRECANREELLGAIARGWCSEKNQHKPMDSDLALAIVDEVERRILQHFGVQELNNEELAKDADEWYEKLLWDEKK